MAEKVLVVFLLRLLIGYAAPLDPALVITPRLTVEPEDVVFNPDGSTTSVSFQCSATGDPTPQYVWYKEYVDLDRITRQPSYQTSGGTLTIPLPKPADQGRYWCQAYNLYGRVVSVGANLTSAYVDDFDPAQRTGATTTSGNGAFLPCSPPNAYPVPTSGPQLVLLETVQYKKRADSVLIEFFAYGNPTPTLGWRRVDVVGGNSMEFLASAKFEQWNRAMTLTNVSVADQGFYEVTATNTLGTDVKTAQLVIEDIPRYINRLEPQNQFLAPGEYVNLTVTWKDDGRNQVTPYWYYNGVEIVPGNKYMIDNYPTWSSLIVKNAQPHDAGSYQSILQNQYGMVSSFSEVRVGYDEDECTDGRHNCNADASCTNTPGSFKCDCNSGYSGDGVTCNGVQCPTLTAPQNGAVTGGNSYQDVVQFTCNHGYQLIGHPSRTCQADGTWTGEDPTCTALGALDITGSEAATSTDFPQTWSLGSFAKQT